MCPVSAYSVAISTRVRDWYVPQSYLYGRLKGFCIAARLQIDTGHVTQGRSFSLGILDRLGHPQSLVEMPALRETGCNGGESHTQRFPVTDFAPT